MSLWYANLSFYVDCGELGKYGKSRPDQVHLFADRKSLEQNLPRLLNVPVKHDLAAHDCYMDKVWESSVWESGEEDSNGTQRGRSCEVSTDATATSDNKFSYGFFAFMSPRYWYAQDFAARLLQLFDDARDGERCRLHGIKFTKWTDPQPSANGGAPHFFYKLKIGPVQRQWT